MGNRNDGGTYHRYLSHQAAIDGKLGSKIIREARENEKKIAGFSDSDKKEEKK